MRQIQSGTQESQVFLFRPPVRNRAASLAAELGDEELDERIRYGWDEWVEIQATLLATGGMLPSPEIAERATAFFTNSYWRAEEAHLEALRRQRRLSRLGRSISQRGLELA